MTLLAEFDYQVAIDGQRLTLANNRRKSKPLSKLSELQRRIIVYLATAPAFEFWRGRATQPELLAALFGFEPTYPRSGPRGGHRHAVAGAMRYAGSHGRPQDWCRLYLSTPESRYTSFREYLANAAGEGETRHFDPDVIGRGRYTSAKVALSRSLRRLTDRELVVTWARCAALGVNFRPRVELTAAGWSVAEQLGAIGGAR